MTHATTPWGFSPLTGVQNSNMNISQTVKNYVACHISMETSRQVETIQRIIDPEYIWVAPGATWVDINDNR